VVEKSGTGSFTEAEKEMAKSVSITFATEKASNGSGKIKEVKESRNKTNRNRCASPNPPAFTPSRGHPQHHRYP